MKIVLIGFMGSGKTAISQELGKQLNLPTIDMDDLIEQKAGMTTPEIFDKFGEKRFRELETEVAKELGKKSNIIIATGGGVIVNGINVKYLRNNGGKIIYLQTTFDEITKRVQKHNRPRPLFASLDKAKKLFILRLEKYKNFSDFIVTTDNKNVSAISDEIINNIRI